MSAQHDRALEALQRRGRLRALKPQRGLDFSSNDYLGLAASGELRAAVMAAVERGVPIGAGGSRLLRGNTNEHELLEYEAARFFGTESALFLGSGFTANTALFSTLPQRGDLILHDELIHASVHEGTRLSKAETRAFQHNDAGRCEDVIKAWRGGGGSGQVWIAVETLYSMDGDRAPLAELAGIAQRYEAMLVLDEAHATGVFGPYGRGLGADLEGHPNVVSVHTCGKALGVMGALITGPSNLRDFLINRARSFIYATAPSPLVAAAVRASLEISRTEPQRRQALAARSTRAQALIRERLGLESKPSHIQPIVVGTDARAVSLAGAIQKHGFDVRAIRPPTVPEGTARLRITLTLNTTEADVETLIETLAAELTRYAE